MRIPIVLLLASAVAAFAADPTDAELQRNLTNTVRPFVASYCAGCHSGPKPMAQLDLTSFTTVASVAQDYPHWALVLEKLTTKQMPPAQAKQPEPEARQKVIDFVEAIRKSEAKKHAGDPGLVLARRLSNAEYNYTIRDLTGVDLRPTKEFPVDPANPAGFDNSGESLAMSPSLLNKYLEAARDVANHMFLRRSGIGFAPYPMLVETDRDKYCVEQILNFYRAHDTDYSDFFQAAWRYKHRAALGKPRATLASIAAESKVSSKYLATIWNTLEIAKEEVGPGAKLQAMWKELPGPTGNPKAGADKMRDYVIAIRKKTQAKVTLVDGGRGGAGGPGGQPFLMFRNNQYATQRNKIDPSVLQVEGEWKPVVAAAAHRRVPADNADEDEPAPQTAKATGPDPDLRVPAGQREKYEAAFARFAAVFPDTFYISERGRYFPDNTRDTGRHLSAGFHNLMGYFRDDLPFYQLILDEKEQKQLDELWNEMDFVASTTIRTYTQFYLYESGELRTPTAAEAAATPRITPEDKGITSEPRIQLVRSHYLARPQIKSNPLAVKAVEEHFDSVNRTIRWTEKARLEAEPVHLEALVKFAARAYRRPLTAAEREDLLGYYRSLREKNGLTHEEAIRDSIVSVLMSPDFCYRIDLVQAGARTGAARTAAAGAGRPLPDYALASRLSYFLWSSMPDDELLAHAAAGDLRRPEVIAAEARRMLKDSRSRGLATEFGGNWLDFRRFEEHNAVDRERFPSFNNELREAMFEEPIRYIGDVIANNRSILDFVYGNYTFVNPALAKHYGMTDVAVKPGEWVRVDDAAKYGRGGLVAMSVFLTKNAPGLRTSPVKRGYWVVRRLLGETIPPPPAMVPELPRDEAKFDLPLRDLLAQHRKDPSCAACHARFDSFGLALEGYGPIGEKRTTDLAGHAVDAHASFPGGGEGDGLEGIRSYIRAKRQNDFVEGLCRKILVYALGRSLMLSDEPLIEAMRTKMAANNYRFATMVDSIVTSPQFLTKRGPEETEQKGD